MSWDLIDVKNALMEINRFYVQALKYVLCLYVCEGVTNCFGATKPWF